jgi:phage terminase large subunit GpA-like protein
MHDVLVSHDIPSLFESAVPGPGYWHLNADTTDEILSHLTAEEQRPIRTRRKQRYELVWVLKKEHLPNHIWDAKVYSSFVAELMRWKTSR